MSKEKYKVEITSASAQTDFPRARLEFAGFRLTSSDFKNWSGENEIEVSGQLDYSIKIWAVSGTRWSMKITNVNSNAIVFQDTGHTGDKIPNHSYRSGSTNPQ